MKACVLCPGPSLAGLIGEPIRERYDLIVGVNRAVELLECDYWVALDTRTFGITNVSGKPILVTSSVHYRKMCQEWPRAREFEHLDHKTLVQRKLSPGWSTKGLLTAVVLACAKGATNIDCYGVDWKGTADFDGKTFPRQKRTRKRWEKETRRFGQLSQALAKRGVMVRRVGPTAEAPLRPARALRPH